MRAVSLIFFPSVILAGRSVILGEECCALGKRKGLVAHLAQQRGQAGWRDGGCPQEGVPKGWGVMAWNR